MSCWNDLPLQSTGSPGHYLVHQHLCVDPKPGSPQHKVQALERIAMGMIADPVAYAREVTGFQAVSLP